MHQSGTRAAYLPRIDVLLDTGDCIELIERYGRVLTREALRHAVARYGSRLTSGGTTVAHPTQIISAAHAWLQARTTSTFRCVFNLTGTVLHTNLGRACLPETAISAVVQAARGATNLEYDLESGRRGDRDDHVERLLARLTGAEAATIVNNNAAAVVIALNTLALRKEVLVSRGELIEIGGSFRMPDIMARAGCRLREVGTTNRTHRHDYADAITRRTAAIMKVHTSNYRIDGFTAAVPERVLARIAHASGLVFTVDLGSGSLFDLAALGLPHEPTPAEAIAAGADLVTFSGDKLLGGPQAGLIVGRRALIERLKSNPLKRALRVDKMTLAALSAVLLLYEQPEKLLDALPTLRLLARPEGEIRATAAFLMPSLSQALENDARVELTACASEIGSGALPGQTIPSAGLKIIPRKKSGRALDRIRRAFRELPVPVIGRVHKGALLLDMRTLDDVPAFRSQLALLAATLKRVPT